jgi:hypothetical protein
MSAALAVSVTAGVYAAFAGLYFASARRSEQSLMASAPAQLGLRAIAVAVALGALAGCIRLAGAESGVALWLALICAAGIAGLLAAAVSRRLLMVSALAAIVTSAASLALYFGV